MTRLQPPIFHPKCQQPLYLMLRNGVRESIKLYQDLQDLKIDAKFVEELI
jgi:hypothetical protein